MILNFKNKNTDQNIKVELRGNDPSSSSIVVNETDNKSIVTTDNSIGFCLSPVPKPVCADCKDNLKSLEYIYLDDNTLYDVYVEHMDVPVKRSLTTSQILQYFSKTPIKKVQIDTIKTIDFDISIIKQTFIPS